MPLTTGTRLGPYEILAPLGAGGMGEVYRARDARLKREVAVKVLPASFASDPDRVARFEREAQVLAALNHPRIAAIYGVEEAGTTRALVMELVEGETLADRIARGALPIEEALPIAQQIAEALEAAHEAGIIHRDLKPANIKLRPDGSVKVLDFGLAKALEQPSMHSVRTESPTITSPAMTQAGMILGTAAYMSPEQAKGKRVDKRTDIWAFGCVLYEMLTGQRAFAGEDVSDTLAAILRGEPDWARLPADLADHVRWVLTGCFAKDHQRRLSSMSAASFLLSERLVAPRRAEKPRVAAWLLGATAVIAIVAAAASLIWSTPAAEPGSVPDPRVFELVLPLTRGAGAEIGGTISPDGRLLGYTALSSRGQIELWVRALDGSSDKRLAETRNAHSLFWSPDARWIAYYADGKLMRIDAAGGVPEALATVNTGNGLGRGGSWNADGQILFADRSIKRLDLATRQVSDVTIPEKDDGGHRWPSFLPDGRRFLYSVPRIPREMSAVMLGRLDSGPPKELLRTGSAARFGAPGSLLFSRGGALLAQPFDLESGTVHGDAVRIAESIDYLDDTGAASFSVDDGGSLFYALPAGARPNQLRWYDRSGKILEEVQHEPFRLGGYSFSMSPKGDRAAISRVEANDTKLWILDLAHGAMSRVPSEAGSMTNSVWMPDGRSVIYQVGAERLSQKSVDTAAPETVLAAGLGGVSPSDVSRDGRHLLFTRGVQGKRNGGIGRLPLDGDKVPVPVVTADASQGQFSPDGKWLAYVTHDGERPEVAIQRFPSGDDRRRISSAGGHSPRWAPDGRELYYISGTGDLTSVALAGEGLTPAAPTVLFRTSLATVGTTYRYAVSPDGKRFLFADTTSPDSVSVRVLLNWPAIVARRQAPGSQ